MCLSIVGTVILLKMCLVGCGDSHGTGLDPEEFKEVSAELTGGLDGNAGQWGDHLHYSIPPSVYW